MTQSTVSGATNVRSKFARRIALSICVVIFSANLAPGAEGVSPEDVREFGTKVSKAVEDSDLVAFNELIDWNGILNDVCSLPDTDALEKTRKDFKIGFRKATKTKDSICGAIISTVENGGVYQMTHEGTEEGRPYALFRLVLADNGGVNFHKYYLKKGADELVVASDMYIYLSAEPLTETFRRSWAPLANQVLNTQKNGSGEKSEEWEKFAKSVGDMGKFFDLINKEKNEEALKLYQQFPEETQREKLVLINRMRVAQRISPDAYAASIEDIRKFHPDDPSLDFLLIDGFLLQDKPEEALHCIDKTRESIGGDAYLTVMRANVLTKMGKMEEAIESLKEAEAEEPDLQSVFALGLDICLAAKDYDLTAKYLTKLETDFDFKWMDLTKVEVFKDFTESPQFQEWLKRNDEK